jgi:hypothetical protein
LTLPAARTRRLSGSFAPWGICAWLAAATAWYVWTAVKALGHPLNTGADLLWAGVWLLFAALVLVSRAVLDPSAHAILWQFAIVAAALAMAVLSRQGVAVLITLWLLALAWAMGDWLLARLGASDSLPGADSPAPFEHTCLAVALGLALLAFLALCLALAGGLTAAWIRGALILLTLIRAPWLWDRFRRTLRSGAPGRFSGTPGALPERGAVLALLGFVALVNFAWALAPEIQYDALNYQLAVPATYAAEHRLVNLPVYWHSYFAHLVNMVFALALALHGPAAAKLLVYATGILAALSAYALGRSLFHERVGLWAAALFYTTPLVGWLSSTAYVDLPVTLFFSASLMALLRWRATRATGWIGVSGLLAGAALGSKLTALCAAVSLLAVLAVLLWREAGLSPARKAGALAAFLLGLGLVAAPWYLIVFVFTGNPFFPLFNGIFRSPGWDPVNTNLNAGLFGIGTSPGSLVRLPFALTFDTSRFGEAMPDGGVGLALALVPAVLLGWKALSGKRLLLAITACYLIVWAFNVQYARYYIPLLPVVCVLAMAAAVSVPERRLLRANLALVGVVLLAQVPLHFLQYWNIPERVPVPLAFGAETREAFLGRALGGIYDAVRHLNAAALPGEKTLTGGADAMRFYLKAPLASMSETFDLKRICDALPPARLAQNLLNNGYAWLLVNGEIDRNRPDPFSSSVFLRRFATLEFQHGSGRVYRIHAEENVGSAASNLLENPGFETLDFHGRPAVWAANGRPAVVRGSEAHTGEVAVLSDSENFVSQPVAVEPGSQYLLRHWTRAAQPGSSARLQVNWLDQRAQMLDASIEVVPASPRWASNEMLVTAPERAVTAVVFASVHEGGKVLFDDFSFAPAGQAPR